MDKHGKKAWWNVKRSVNFEMLVSGQTVTAEVYTQQLTLVNVAPRRQGVEGPSIEFFHATSCEDCSAEIEKLGREVSPQLPYSPKSVSSVYLLSIDASRIVGERIQQH